uniref:NADH dehydrogenase [ubiquinone] 1 beta subcomplex subunit 6 n=1 Tax=Phallusia mammillata TaxID=59560 RepID=A0A6F9DLE2_9ASCI|nr:NADH dehydrogenase [ubiquinone] 1 beta subcomplex subunit 6 [Phallusia mammillata]
MAVTEAVAAGMYKDMDRLVEMRKKGEILSALDEQRLRDYQLRRLRRLWLKDQILSAREPLHPPKKEGFFTKLWAREEAFWSRHLKFRQFSGHFYHGHYGKVPLLLLYRAQRWFRSFYGVMIIPSFPLVYFLTHYKFEVPNCFYRTTMHTFPGDKHFKSKIKDLEFDPIRYTYVNPENKTK